MIEVQFRRILAHKISVAEQIVAGLIKSGQMRATPADAEHLLVPARSKSASGASRSLEDGLLRRPGGDTPASRR